MLVYSLDELKKFCSDTQGDEDTEIIGVYINGNAGEMLFAPKEEVYKSIGIACRLNAMVIDVNRVGGSNYLIIRSINYVK